MLLACLLVSSTSPHPDIMDYGKPPSRFRLLRYNIEDFDPQTAKLATGLPLEGLEIDSTFALPLLGDRRCGEILTKDGPVGVFAAYLIIGANKLELGWSILYSAFA